MAERTDLLVIGAGPYAYSAAACARDHGIDTRVVGLPMSFWREQMPADMYLRSGPDWHLDTAGEHTFAAYFEDRGLSRADHDPVPIGVFLDHTDWFREQKGFDVDERLVDTVEADDTGAGFVATMEDGTTITAEKVLAAPGIRHFVTLPAWHEGVPEHRRAHTCDLVDFDALAGARVVVVGGRQSAYEWAALLCDHGAASVDVVHRHPAPAFERVSWEFVDPYVEQTLRPARLVALAASGRAARHRPGVLAGRPAHPRALADTAAEARRRHGARVLRGRRRRGGRRGDRARASPTGRA